MGNKNYYERFLDSLENLSDEEFIEKLEEAGLDEDCFYEQADFDISMCSQPRYTYNEKVLSIRDDSGNLEKNISFGKKKGRCRRSPI